MAQCPLHCKYAAGSFEPIPVTSSQLLLGFMAQVAEPGGPGPHFFSKDGARGP